MTVSAANVWGTIFMVIMQIGVSVAIMQVVFSAVHYAHDMTVSIVIMQVTFLYSYVGDSFICHIPFSN